MSSTIIDFFHNDGGGQKYKLSVKKGYTIETILYHHSFPYYFDMMYTRSGVNVALGSNSSARLRISPGAFTDYGIDQYTSVGWHHYALQIDPSDSPLIKIYLDGNLVYSVNYSSSGMINEGYLMYFGQSEAKWHCYMSLDSLRVSNIPRYNSNFEAPTELVEDQHTVSMFNFFEDTIYDTSHNMCYVVNQGTVTFDSTFGREPHTSSLKLYPGRILILGDLPIDTTM